MAEARIFYSGKPDHTLRLAEGPNLFGSSFNSDVVLFDEAVSPSHFCITLQNSGATVATADDAAVTLTDADGSVLSLEPGQTAPLVETQVLRIGITEIRFRDLPQPGTDRPASATDLSPRFRRIGRKPSVAVFLAGALGVALYFGAPLTRGESGTMGVVEASSMPAPAMNMSTEEPPGPKVAIDDLKGSLTAAGFPPEGLSYNGSEYEAQFYVARNSDHQALLAHLAGLDEKVIARVYVDEAVRRAAELAVSMTGSAEIKIEVKSAHLVIRGAGADAGLRSTLADMLKRDIPGLRSVSFEGRSEAWKEQFDDRLAAVWSGPNPYLVLTDGRKILQGQSIDEDTVFRGIQGKSILLVTGDEAPLEYILK